MERINQITKPQDDYELVDTGDSEKLERFGNIMLVRPDPQVLWQKRLPESVWESAQGCYVRSGEQGRWTGKLPDQWPVKFAELILSIKPTSFKHTGLFPEQLSNWRWTEDQVRSSGRKPVSVLNLFGYTGGATLAVARAGAEVTHIDASKSAVAWARENAALSGLEQKPIRWIVEDALVFVRREIKRGNKYDGIIMDPPAFGRGPKDEIWKIEENFSELVELCMELLTDKPLFFLVNGYAAGYSPLAFAYNLEPLEQKFGGSIEYGDLTIEEKGSERLLPAGIFARWKNQ